MRIMAWCRGDPEVEGGKGSGDFERKFAKDVITNPITSRFAGITLFIHLGDEGSR
jgi:hypothetical protein